MLSYRHGFHAGNHADVLKHIVLLECVRAMRRKDTPILYVDTHAGAGGYALDGGFATLNEEWAGGIARLGAFAASEEPPEPVASYLEAVRAYGRARGGAYPGSPSLAAAALRPQDRLALFELHPSDYGPLSSLFAEDRRARIHNADGFAGLKGCLPPISRRGLALVDPSYELAADYDRVVERLAEAIRRFATGVYAVWYPLLERDEARMLPARLEGLAARTLDARLRVRSSAPGERGMAGSGMMVINPPWLLDEALERALPYLARALAVDPGASWSLRRSS